jgi:hypothetical protein
MCKCVQLGGGVHKMTAVIEMMQKETPSKDDAQARTRSRDRARPHCTHARTQVLLLNVCDETSSGSNLTQACNRQQATGNRQHETLQHAPCNGEQGTRTCDRGHKASTCNR